MALAHTVYEPVKPGLLSDDVTADRSSRDEVSAHLTQATHEFLKIKKENYSKSVTCSQTNRAAF